MVRRRERRKAEVRSHGVFVLIQQFFVSLWRESQNLKGPEEASSDRNDSQEIPANGCMASSKTKE